MSQAPNPNDATTPLPTLSSPSTSSSSFAYRGVAQDGTTMSGTIDATDPADARRRLEYLGLREIDVSARPLAQSALTAQDFLAFNQQLAFLTSAGLPLERGLRLIAKDAGKQGLAATIDALAADLEAGMPLAEAFERRRAQFPPAYGRLLEAGVRSGNLSAMLFNLSRHVELVGRLRAMLWRTLSYPLMVLLAAALMTAFLSIYVLPQFEAIFSNSIFRMYARRVGPNSVEYVNGLPLLTEWVLGAGRWMPLVLAGVGVLIVCGILIWTYLRATGRDAAAIDRLVLPLPLVGPVLRHNLLARWCDAVRVGVAAGKDLPTAIELGGEVVGSPALAADGHQLVAHMSRGTGVDVVEGGRLIPATVTATLQIASYRNQLAEALAGLSDMYQRQAESRLAFLPTILTPVMLLTIAAVIGLVILALFLPMIRMLTSVS